MMALDHTNKRHTGTFSTVFKAKDLSDTPLPFNRWKLPRYSLRRFALKFILQTSGCRRIVDEIKLLRTLS
jgi:hypothetical protein